MERILRRVIFVLIRRLFPKLSGGVNLELIRRLSVLDFNILVAAIRRPDLEGMQQTERVFTGFIRHLVEPHVGDYDHHVVTRDTPLEKGDITSLYKEVVAGLTVAEGDDKFGYNIRKAFEHFFAHIKWAMEVFEKLAPPLIAEEEQYEAEALAALADALRDLFRYANLDVHLGSGRTALRLWQKVWGWAARWYPNWGKDWLPLER